jgi:hypothetical protein
MLSQTYYVIVSPTGEVVTRWKSNYVPGIYKTLGSARSVLGHQFSAYHRFEYPSREHTYEKKNYELMHEKGWRIIPVTVTPC